MTGKLHITTLSRPELSAGSSVSTAGSGSGRYIAAGAGWLGSEMSIACRPPECQVTNARFGVSVGLCDEKLEKFSRSGGTDAQMLASFHGSLYSAATCGWAGSVMSMNRGQPHGQPWAGSSAPSLPYTSSVVMTQFGLPGIWIALCA